MTYNEIIKEIETLGEIKYFAITPLGYKIPMVTLGSGKAHTLIVSSIHAREHITYDLTKLLASNYPPNLGAIDYVPILNIDGVLLAKNGYSFICNTALKKDLLQQNDYNNDFSDWKSNINGVDLNVNFDADWGEGEQNITYPYKQNYIGPQANSETETQGIVNLLKNNDYSLVISYHSKGEVVYWGYEYNFRHYKYAKMVTDNLGYSLQRSLNSCGGLKDYYSLNYKGLGLTIEVGENKYEHPYPIEQLPNLYEKHKTSWLLYSKIGGEIAKLNVPSLKRGIDSF